MPVPSTTVEVGFDLSGLGGPFFTLDDSVQGVLDNTQFTLGGTLFYDVTDRVRNISVTRGKSRELDRFTAGQTVVEFNNNDRAFDPLFTSSPFFGQIIPRRDVRIQANGSAVFYGYVDDWNLNYSTDGLSTCRMDASDAFTILAQQALTGGSATSQLTGARFNAILDRPEIQWPATQRDIEVGQETLQADFIEPNTNVLEYLQLVNNSEPGSFFVGAEGDLTFVDRSDAISSTGLPVFSDDGTGIPFVELGVVYGSELLYNRIIVSRLNGGTAIADDTDSQNAYGISVLEVENILVATDSDATSLASYLLGQYSEPEYRFETLGVALEDLSDANTATVLGVELGDVVQIKFTPNGVGTQIDKYARVIAVDHSIVTGSHRLVFGFQTLDYASFILDDSEFGKLDTGRLGF
jgi:hypothetical protein